MPARVSFYRPTGHSRRANKQQFDHDVFEGLPIRRWDRQWQWVSRTNPPPPSQPELPLPKDTPMLQPLAQSLLQAARNGTLQQIHHQPPQEDIIDDDDNLSISVSVSTPGSSKDAGTPDPNAPGSSKRLFMTNQWSCLPRQGEPPEPVYLSRMPDSHVRRTRKIQHRLNGSKVVFVDDVEEPEPSPPAPAVAAAAAGEAAGATPASAVQTPLKKRPPPPRRKPGRGRKPGMKKGGSISGNIPGPQTPNAREGSIINTDGDMEMIDADDSLMHTPASRVESDSAGSAVSTPDVRASAGPMLPELPPLTPGQLPEPPRSVPETGSLDIEMGNSSDAVVASTTTPPPPPVPMHAVPAVVEHAPHPLSREITVDPTPTLKTETTPPVDLPSIPEPAPIEPKEEEPAVQELAMQDQAQEDIAKHELAQPEVPAAVVASVAAAAAVEPIKPASPPPLAKLESPPALQKAKSPSPRPASPPRDATPPPSISAPPTTVIPSPPRAISPPAPPKEATPPPVMLPPHQLSPVLASVAAPVLAPSPVPEVKEAAPEVPPVPIEAPLPPPISVASPPSTTAEHAQRLESVKSPKPLPVVEENAPITNGVPSHTIEPSISALLNGNSPAKVEEKVEEKAEEKVTSPTPPPTNTAPAKAASPKEDNNDKIPDVTSPSAAAAGPQKMVEKSDVADKEEVRAQTPPEASEAL